jgi:hypothetical protein
MNYCKWLMIGLTTPCNKLSKNQYCGFLMVSVRRGSTGPKPCIVCGVGVRGKSQLCVQCGGKKYRELKRYYDVFTHINHRSSVINSPSDYINRQFKDNNLDKEKPYKINE